MNYFFCSHLIALVHFGVPITSNQESTGTVHLNAKKNNIKFPRETSWHKTHSDSLAQTDLNNLKSILKTNEVMVTVCLKPEIRHIAQVQIKQQKKLNPL